MKNLFIEAACSSEKEKERAIKEKAYLCIKKENAILPKRK